MEITMKKTKDTTVVLENIADTEENFAARIEAKNIEVWYEDFKAIKGI